MNSLSLLLEHGPYYVSAVLVCITSASYSINQCIDLWLINVGFHADDSRRSELSLIRCKRSATAHVSRVHAGMTRAILWIPLIKDSLRSVTITPSRHGVPSLRRLRPSAFYSKTKLYSFQ